MNDPLAATLAPTPPAQPQLGMPPQPNMQPGMPSPPTLAPPVAPPVGPQPWPAAQLYGPTGMPIWWQDDPAAHLASLNEIILDESKPFPLRKLAADRSTIYEQLAQAKADPLQPVPPEVIGVPLNRLLSQGAITPPSLVPQQQGQPAVAPPGSAPQPAVAGMSDHPEPLGAVGALEHGLRQ